MKEKSINKAKKEIWLNLQALVGDPDYWESTIDDMDFNKISFEKALNSIWWQLEGKVAP